MILPMHPFRYDPFQQEAITAIQEGVSVFVSAPTGAGKTVIAEGAVEETFRKTHGFKNLSPGLVIYTAPIKALSNQKFRDFHARYGDRVGILTGDVTLNPEAPLLIMTTEIYRNSLLERSDRFADCRWVIFDEVHYLGDPERGTVWEESILLTPRSTEILALSATIPNAQELARWIERIHGRPVKVVEETDRPVPLKFAFQCQDQLYWDLGAVKAKGYGNQELWIRKPSGRRPTLRFRGGRRSFRWVQAKPEGPFAKANRADHLLQAIQSAGHLPCLYFTFSRRRAEELAWEFVSLGFVTAQTKNHLLEKFDQLCQRYQLTHERSACSMRELIAQGVAFHHAGLLPTLKEVVEKLFSSRLIPVIVTTETFALGVNMPARSVVLDTLARRTGGPGRSVLRVGELLQMVGRAGRRGMDEAGFVYLRVNPWEVPFHELTHLIHGTPEPVVSRFSSTYATLLCLYRNYGAKLLPFYSQTFHAFQASQVDQREVYSLTERKLALLEKLGYVVKGAGSTLRPSEAPNSGQARPLTPKGVFASGLYGYELILSELLEAGWLNQLATTDLAIFLLAMVYEPRRHSAPVKLAHRIRGLESQVREVVAGIHREERLLRIGPLSKPPAFHLSLAMEQWVGGSRFDKVVQTADVDEGELIRYFRMTVQMVRSVAMALMVSTGLKEKARSLLKRINRDEVDAEAELRRSL